MKNKLYFIVLIQFLTSSFAFASDEQLHPKKNEWPFDGALGTLDRSAAQRGYKVYKEVCSSCHSMNLLSFRNLGDLGFSESEVKALAAEHQVQDGPNDQGEMFSRPAIPSDHFVNPFANEKAARASNNGAYPPDLSLIVKARHDGANYIYSILTGFQTAPKEIHIADGMYYNPYFPNHQIGMAPPLSDGLVTFDDGTADTVEQMSKDVVVFLQWAAEPDMEKRKKMGLKTILYLVIMTGLFFAAKKIVWKNVK